MSDWMSDAEVVGRVHVLRGSGVADLPDGVQNFLKVLGAPWPEGNGARLYSLRDSWDVCVRWLEELLGVVRELSPEVGAVLVGEVGEFVGGWLGGDAVSGLEGGITAGRELSKMLTRGAADTVKGQIEMVVMSLLALAAIVSLLSSVVGALLVPVVEAAARVGLWALFRELLVRLGSLSVEAAVAGASAAIRSGAGAAAARLGAVTWREVGGAVVVTGKQAVKFGVMGAGLMGGMDLGIQGVQKAAGLRDEVDVRSVLSAVEGGFIGGATAGVFHAAALGGAVVGRSAVVAVAVAGRVPRYVSAVGDVVYAGGQVGAAVVSAPLVNVVTDSPGALTAGVLGALSRFGGGRRGGGSGGGDVGTLDAALAAVGGVRPVPVVSGVVKGDVKSETGGGVEAGVADAAVGVEVSPPPYSVVPVVERGGDVVLPSYEDSRVVVGGRGLGVVFGGVGLSGVDGGGVSAGTPQGALAVTASPGEHVPGPHSAATAGTTLSKAAAGGPGASPAYGTNVRSGRTAVAGVVPGSGKTGDALFSAEAPEVSATAGKPLATRAVEPVGRGAVPPRTLEHFLSEPPKHAHSQVADVVVTRSARTGDGRTTADSDVAIGSAVASGTRDSGGFTDDTVTEGRGSLRDEEAGLMVVESPAGPVIAVPLSREGGPAGVGFVAPAEAAALRAAVARGQFPADAFVVATHQAGGEFAVSRPEGGEARLTPEALVATMSGLPTHLAAWSRWSKATVVTCDLREPTWHRLRDTALADPRLRKVAMSPYSLNTQVRLAADGTTHTGTNLPPGPPGSVTLAPPPGPRSTPAPTLLPPDVRAAVEDWRPEPGGPPTFKHFLLENHHATNAQLTPNGAGILPAWGTALLEAWILAADSHGPARLADSRLAELSGGLITPATMNTWLREGGPDLPPPETLTAVEDWRPEPGGPPTFKHFLLENHHAAEAQLTPNGAGMLPPWGRALVEAWVIAADLPGPARLTVDRTSELSGHLIKPSTVSIWRRDAGTALPAPEALAEAGRWRPAAGGPQTFKDFLLENHHATEAQLTPNKAGVLPAWGKALATAWVIDTDSPGPARLMDDEVTKRSGGLLKQSTVARWRRTGEFGSASLSLPTAESLAEAEAWRPASGGPRTFKAFLLEHHHATEAQLTPNGAGTLSVWGKSLLKAWVIASDAPGPGRLASDRVAELSGDLVKRVTVNTWRRDAGAKLPSRETRQEVQGWRPAADGPATFKAFLLDNNYATEAQLVANESEPLPAWGRALLKAWVIASDAPGPARLKDHDVAKLSGGLVKPKAVIAWRRRAAPEIALPAAETLAEVQNWRPVPGGPPTFKAFLLENHHATEAQLIASGPGVLPAWGKALLEAWVIASDAPGPARLVAEKVVELSGGLIKRASVQSWRRQAGTALPHAEALAEVENWRPVPGGPPTFKHFLLENHHATEAQLTPNTTGILPAWGKALVEAWVVASGTPGPARLNAEKAAELSGELIRRVTVNVWRRQADTALPPVETLAEVKGWRPRGRKAGHVQAVPPRKPPRHQRPAHPQRNRDPAGVGKSAGESVGDRLGDARTGTPDRRKGRGPVRWPALPGHGGLLATASRGPAPGSGITHHGADRRPLRCRCLTRRVGDRLGSRRNRRPWPTATIAARCGRGRLGPDGRMAPGSHRDAGR
ncbi:hypothetical protein [Amycolatopsis sp. WQ 127309]|uniref:hypothetical protein n=1 Tax=Amycolatopsis sp. WQ 127309 TaxID=2932773 RepID=UPI002112E5A0|nr:hypothetical protein [Amycolatopsis sp. WQ 127309]